MTNDTMRSEIERRMKSYANEVDKALTLSTASLHETARHAFEELLAWFDAVVASEPVAAFPSISYYSWQSYSGRWESCQACGGTGRINQFPVYPYSATTTPSETITSQGMVQTVICGLCNGIGGWWVPYQSRLDYPYYPIVVCNVRASS